VLPPAWPPASLLTAPPSAVVWLRDYDEAVRTAVAQRRGLLVDFYADWCVPCRRMDHEVFSDAAVAKASSGERVCHVGIRTGWSDSEMKTQMDAEFPTCVVNSTAGESGGQQTLRRKKRKLPVSWSKTQI
jgi:thiol:disulfide interchange protein